MREVPIDGSRSGSGLRLCKAVLFMLCLARPAPALDFRHVAAFGVKAWATRREVDLRLSLLGFNVVKHSVSKTGIETDRYEKRGQFIVLSAINGETFELETSRVSVGSATLNKGDAVGAILTKIGRPTRIVNNKHPHLDEWWIYEDANNSTSLGIQFLGGTVTKFRFNFV